LFDFLGIEISGDGIMDNALHVTGTLIWYYYICHREVWLMARNIVPDQEDENIDLGRFIQRDSYRRDKKEVNFGHIQFDLVRREGGQVVIGEVKKSSKAAQSAKMQLAFYLSELRAAGIEAVGELLFPKEKTKVRVELTAELAQEIEQAKRDILRIAYLDAPPEARKIPFCRNCAYAEFCWA